MRKISTIHLDKIWGWEKWIYSPLGLHNSKFEDTNEFVKGGQLIKILYAKDKLSIQVHPDDKLAKELEKEPNGKSECWFVLETKSKNQKIQVGLKTYDLNLIKKHVDNRTLDDILNYINIKSHDFVDVPAGLVHGVCGGTVVLEIQQPSDITYRLFDFNRKQANGEYRELHIEKSLKSIKNLKWEKKPISLNPLTYENEICTISYFNKPSTLDNDGIVVNLKNYETFLCQKNEKINFTEFVFILKSW